MDDDVFGYILQVSILVCSLIYFPLLSLSPDSGLTLTVRAIIYVLGFLYVGYSVMVADSDTKKMLLVVNMVLSLILILMFRYLYAVGDCTLTAPCPEGSFCGADHLCHTPPEYTTRVDKLIVVQKIGLSFGGFMVGGSLLLAALLLRNTSFVPNLKKLLFGKK